MQLMSIGRAITSWLRNSNTPKSDKGDRNCGAEIMPGNIHPAPLPHRRGAQTTTVAAEDL
jgi:hypothetical protein